jgi:hypothetical protein
MPSLQWSRYALGSLAKLLGDAYSDSGDCDRLARRAGCTELGDVPTGKTRAENWEHMLVFCADQGKFEDLLLQIESELKGRVGEELTKQMRFAGSRRFVELLGDKYSKLASAAFALIEHEDLAKQLEETSNLREIAVGLYKEFGNDVSWQALTVMKVSQYEIQATRNQFLAMSMNIINAADYMLTIARPLLPGEPRPGSEGQTIRLSDLENGINFPDQARRVRGVLDARTFLHDRAQDLYLSLRDSVTLAPGS